MVEHKCNSCFYMQHERNRHPCNVCEGYNKYVNRNIYIQRPDTVEIKEWDEEDAFDGYYGGSEDYVTRTNDVVNSPAERKLEDNVFSPKHYMLFDKGFYPEGIEVRNVLEKLSQKVYESEYTPKNMPMVLSDYVQMMQYFMRFMEKNGKEDLEKGLWFLHRVLEAYE